MSAVTNDDSLVTIVSLLRTEGSDTAAIEAKAARGGLPEGTANLLSAFANRPGGGTIILGLDETQGFATCRVFDVRAAQQGIASIARTALEPPVQVVTEVVSFEGERLVVVQVHEADPASKPARVKASGKAFLRQYDGTFTLSAAEEQAFIAARTQPCHDRAPVPSSSLADLDPVAVAAFVRARRAQSSVFVGWSDDRVLTQAGIVTAGGEATMAGLLALGVFPQSFLPSLGIQASSWNGKVRGAGSRVLDSAVFEGPVATMLDNAEAWVARNCATAIVEGARGSLHDEPQFPPRAVRELVANALIHRDLGPYALGRYVSLTLEPGTLTISNPGGLYGVTVDGLGHTDSSLRNTWLASVLLSVRTPAGTRVVERLGSGIPATRDAMRRAGLPEPQFFDTGIGFTARLCGTRGVHAPDAADHGAQRAAVGPAAVRGMTTTQAAVVAALTEVPATAAQVVQRSGLTLRQVRHALRALVASGRVTTDGAARNVGYARARPGT